MWGPVKSRGQGCLSIRVEGAICAGAGHDERRDGDSRMYSGSLGHCICLSLSIPGRDEVRSERASRGGGAGESVTGLHR